MLQERALLAERRPLGMPPITVAAEMPESSQWAAVDVELPFEEVNDMLGVQLDRVVARGRPLDW